MFAFEAELEVTEIDDRLRPGAWFSAKGKELGRSSVVFVSRRMVHIGRLVLLAVHMIDDRPTPLFGQVGSCEYDTDGMHRLSIDLRPLPDQVLIDEWMATLGRNNA